MKIVVSKNAFEEEILKDNTDKIIIKYGDCDYVIQKIDGGRLQIRKNAFGGDGRLEIQPSCSNVINII